MIVMFIIGSSLLMVMGMEARRDIWLSIILAMVASAIIMLIYIRLLTVLPNKNFFETMEFFLGKVGSKIAIGLITWFSFDLCAIVLRNFAQFVSTVGLKETPMYAIMAIMMITCALAVRYGIDIIGHWTETFIFIVILFLVVSVGLVSKNIEISNILPIFDKGFKPIVKGAFGVVTFPFVETVVFLLVFPKFKKDASVKKIFLNGLLFGGLLILMTSLADILVLGCSLAEAEYYPTYTTFSTVHLGDFIHRLEAFAAIVFIVSVFFKLSILLLGACNGVAKLFGFETDTFVIVPISLLVINFALFSFDSMIYYHDWTNKVFRYYGSIFEIIIPLIILIIIQVRIRLMNAARSKALNTDQ